MVSILRETVDERSVTKEEILEYAQYLGMDVEQDHDLLYFAERGLKSSLPSEWKPCRTDDDEIFYWNSETGQSVWEHPVDSFYKEEYLRAKAKKDSPACLVNINGYMKTPSIVCLQCSGALSGDELTTMHVRASLTAREFSRQVEKQLGVRGKKVELIANGERVCEDQKNDSVSSILGLVQPKACRSGEDCSTTSSFPGAADQALERERYVHLECSRCGERLFTDLVDFVQCEPPTPGLDCQIFTNVAPDNLGELFDTKFCLRSGVAFNCSKNCHTGRFLIDVGTGMVRKNGYKYAIACMQDFVKVVEAPKVDVCITLTAVADDHGCANILAMKLDGTSVAAVAVPDPVSECYLNVKEKLLSQMVMPADTLPKFILADGTLLKQEHAEHSIAELFVLI